MQDDKSHPPEHREVKKYSACCHGPNLDKKWVDDIVVQHLKVFMSQPLFNISFAPSEVVVHHKHLISQVSTHRRFIDFKLELMA